MTGARLREAKGGDGKASDGKGGDSGPKPAATDEVDLLRDQLAALQARIDGLQR